MDWLTALPWAGWAVTGAAFGYHLYRHRAAAIVEAATDGWRCVLQDTAGREESSRRAVGSVPIRIDRGRGRRTPQMYRLVAVQGQRFIYRPEI